MDSLAPRRSSASVSSASGSVSAWTSAVTLSACCRYCDVTFIPEFRDIWKDMLFNPAAFSVPEFLDLSVLYQMRTPAHYFLLRVNFEMETQLWFLLTKVKWGSDRLYLEWFGKKFLGKPEQETVVVDMIRFVVCGIHPTNEVLQSGIVPRWAVVGWLLKCCRRNYMEANAKLALFFDWLFFDEKDGNIMDVEPAMLLMMHSLSKYANFTCTLMEFLFILVDNYDTVRKDMIFHGVHAAFDACVKKGVVHSLDTLTSCELIPSALRNKLFLLVSKVNADTLTNSLAPKESKVTNVGLDGMIDLRSNKESDMISKSDPTIRSPLSQEAERIRESSLSCRSESIEALGASSIQVENIAESIQPSSMDMALVKLQNSVSIAKSSGLDLIRNLLPGLKTCIEESKESGLRALKTLLLSFVAFNAMAVDGEDRGSLSVASKGFACQISKIFESVGYEMFLPISLQETEMEPDEEIHSATALVIQAYMFYPHEKMRGMVAFWVEKGRPVGARMLSYSSRLASEAKMLEGSKSVQKSIMTLDLLKNHINNYSSFKLVEVQGGFTEDGVDLKFVSMLIERAFYAYRSFLSFPVTDLDLPSDETQVENHARTGLYKRKKENNESKSRSLYSDLVSCYGWALSKPKELFMSVFSHLSDLSTSRGEFIQLLLEISDSDLVSVEFDISLMRSKIFGEDPESIMKLVTSSLHWDGMKQRKMWGLLALEMSVLNLKVDEIIVHLFTDCVNPFSHSIAIEGLFTLVRNHLPTPELIDALLRLPDNFAEFAAATLAYWLSLGSSHAECLLKWLEGFGNIDASVISRNAMKINCPAIKKLLHFIGKQYKTDKASVPSTIGKIELKLFNLVSNITLT